MQVPRDPRVVHERCDGLDPFVFETGSNPGRAHPGRTGSHEVEQDAVGDPLSIEITDRAPQVLELRTRIDRVVVAPVEHVGIGVVVGALPVLLVDDHAEETHALVDEHVERGYELAVVPRRRIGVDHEPVDDLTPLIAVHGQVDRPGAVADDDGDRR